MKQFLVVAYDISSNRRRRKIAALLEGYGIRCNESVFECIVSESQVKFIKRSIEKIILPKTDSVLLYYLCQPCTLKRESFGCTHPFDPEIVVV